MVNKEITAEMVQCIAEAIGYLDFQVTISRYILGQSWPWIITVGDSQWQRHLVVESTSLYGSEAKLNILSEKQSDKFGYNINHEDVERTITLRELIAGSYSGVITVLRPK